MFRRSGNNRYAASAGIPKDTCLVGVRSLVARRVYDAHGNLVGRLEEIVVDTRTGCVRHVVLAVGGIMGIGRRRLAVPWSALSPEANDRRCVVNVTHMQLTAVQVPDNDPWLQRNQSVQAGKGFYRPGRDFAAKA